VKLRIAPIMTAAALTVWLAGCNTQPAPAEPITTHAFPEPTLPTTAPASASTKGYWSPTEPWPLVAIHASLMPNGDILTWDMSGEDGGGNVTFDSNASIKGSWDYRAGSSSGPYWRRADRWDIRNQTHTRVDNLTTNLFCSGHVLLPDGSLFVVGGHVPLGPFTGSPAVGRQDVGGGTKDTNVFDWRTNAWTLGTPMNKARWYASATVLGDGGVMVAGGHNENAVDVSSIEVYKGGTFTTLTQSDTSGGTSYYPRMFQATNGQVFYAGLQSAMYSINPTDSSPYQFAGDRDGFFRNYGSTVMFERDKILVANGQQPVDLTAGITSISYPKSSYVIDLSKGTDKDNILANKVQLPDVPKGRFQENATILADGSVLVTGGNDDPTGNQNSDTNAVNTPILFKPNADATNGTWTPMADMTQSRQYHSVALLMPDGRVFTAGSGDCARQGCLNGSDRSHEFFWPPYLFNNDGTLARRPKIVSAPSSVQYKQRIRIGTPDAGSISKVTWVRLGSVTHADNMNQRSMTLSFTRSGDTILVNAPENGNVAPPGHYMLFAMNANGTPSIARIIRIDN
jgi:Domain of unknown function (DUF1929)/Glyoxal oxidase N-terminus